MQQVLVIVWDGYSRGSTHRDAQYVHRWIGNTFLIDIVFRFNLGQKFIQRI